MEAITQETEKKNTKKSTKSTKSKIQKVKPENIEEVEEIEGVEEVIEEDLSKIEDLKNSDNEQNDTLEDVESETQNNSEENQISSISEDEYLQELKNALKIFTSIKKIEIKYFDLTKDYIIDANKTMSNIDKTYMQVKHNFIDHMVKENSISLKKKSKKNKVKSTNNQNAGVNKKKMTYPEVLNFLKFSGETEVSRAEILQNINAFVKEQKTNKNPDIFVEGDNTKFFLIGELKVLFDFIKKQMIERGDLKKEDEETFPKYLAYRDIMKYSKYCFLESK